MAPFLTWAAAELGYPYNIGLSHPQIGNKLKSKSLLGRGITGSPKMACCPAAAAAASAAQTAPAAATADVHLANSLTAPQNQPSFIAGETLTALNVPTPLRLGPRVEHIAVPRDGPATDIIAECLGLPKDFVEGLMRFGAVHYSRIHPLPPKKIGRDDPAGQQQLERAQAARAAGAARHGKDPRLSMPRRLTEDAAVHQHGYLRVHVHPKRFPAVYAVDWQGRVIEEYEDFVVLNKPPGVQVAPTIDNMVECCLTLGAQGIGRAEPLLITHRLDTCTEGVLICGKAKAFVQRFNALLLVPGAVRKTYRALARTPLLLGTLVNFVVIRQRQKGGAAHTVVLKEEKPGSLRCELEVLAVQQVSLTGDARSRWGDTAFEHEIQLKTGRTHQIRVQFAAAGAPMLGDHMYAVDEKAPPDVPIAGAPAATVQGKRDVMDPIGLQAYKMEVDDDSGLMETAHASFCAPAPWWRS